MTKTGPVPPAVSPAAARKQRLATALRDNLKRRKAAAKPDKREPKSDDESDKP